MNIDQVVSDLTLAEKASLVMGGDFWHTRAIERLGVPAIMVSDGPHGLRTQLSDVDHAGTHGSEPATCFPTASNLHASWDPELVRRVGAAIAREARALGVSVVLGPGVNIKRSPLCGRNFEYVSEDPFLALDALAMVEGIQGQDVGTSVKHFAANNQETDRLRVSVDVDERTLREIYLPAFERIVKGARPWTVMCSYNWLNGVRVSQNRWLLTDVLRSEWGFEGLVVSDWGAVGDRVPAVQAGLDLEMPPAFGRSDKQIVAAVEAGTLSTDELDACVRRVLKLVEKGRGVLEGEAGNPDFDAHHALAREAAAEGIVLLKNDGVLPLRAGGKVAVIGEFARTARFQGGGSSQVNATRVDKALDVFGEVFGDVPFAPGYSFDAEDAGLVDEAVALARDAETVVVFLGLTDAEESEGFDRPDMNLPPNQLRLLRAVTDVHDRVVVVLSNGSTVQTSTWDDQPEAIVEAWLGGQAIAGAIVDVLSGRVNPGGRLAETIPVRLEDNPSYGNFPGDTGHVRYGEGVLVGYRGYDFKGQDVSYPFGFGLSYTTFEYRDLAVEVSGDAEAGTLAATVRVSVTNTGDTAGSDVVQVYVRDVQASVQRPVRELKGFAKVRLDAGASETVTVELDQRAFSFWSELLGAWAVEGGDFVVEVGRNSRDIVASETVSVDAPAIAEPLNINSSAQEWLADPRGLALLKKHYADESGTLKGPLGDEEFMTVVGNFPLERLTSFAGSTLTYDELLTLLEDLKA